MDTFVIYQIDIQIFELVIYLYKENAYEIKKIKKQIKQKEIEYNNSLKKKDEELEDATLSEKKKLK